MVCLCNESTPFKFLFTSIAMLTTFVWKNARITQTAAAAMRFISVKSILHGSPEAKEAGESEMLQHSRIVGRGKYVHGFETHRVKPDKAEEYKKAAERYYIGIKDDARLHVKLTGSWETVVGEQDTYVHILEYENYGGLSSTTKLLRTCPEVSSTILFCGYLRH